MTTVGESSIETNAIDSMIATNMAVDLNDSSQDATTTTTKSSALVTNNNKMDEESAELTNASIDFATSVAKTEHLGSHRQYWRDILLGVNDGIISTFLLVAGVAGGGLESTSILLTAIAGTVAGAVAMCAGEFIATKSQNEVLQGEIQLERSHVIHHRSEEIQELEGLLEVIGIEPDQVELRQQLLQYYDQNPESLLKVMIALEFGVLDEERRSPVVAGLTNLALFTAGAMPSVVPFCFAESPTNGLIAAAALTVAALMLVGVIKTWATRGNFITAAVENLVIASVGGGLAYGVGALFDGVVQNRMDQD
jgi:VIT1/CCC1 family predicted Fe2+/Mn2+ transporter